MVETFTLGGSPDSIRSSATLWGKFATDASSASTDITGVNTGDFSGDEAETYRGRMSSDLIPHLDVASEAWQLVSSALNVYAGKLESLQSRMNSLKAQYEEQQQAVNTTWSNYQGAKQADDEHTGSDAPAGDYRPQAADAYLLYQNANGVLGDLRSKAADIRREHGEALQACCGDISTAKGKRPVDPPGWLDKLGEIACDVWDSVKEGVSWAAKHLGPVLKAISAVAGLLALIPCLAPVMGPIALVTGGAALLLDVANKLMNDEGSWLQIGLDAVGLVPGVKSLSSLSKMGKFATAARGTRTFKLAQGLETMGNMNRTWKGIEIGSSAVDVGLNTYGAVTGQKSWVDVAAAVVGFKGIGSPRFNSIKEVATSTVKTGAEGYSIYDKMRNGQDVTYLDWIKFGTAAASIGVNGRNTYAYRTPGTHPSTGERRSAYENPKYDWPSSKQAMSQTASTARGWTTRTASSATTWASETATSAKNWGTQQLAAGALTISLLMGPRG